MTWIEILRDLLWASALAAVPLAILVGAACRLLVLRPVTRHGLWLLVLGWFVASPLTPSSKRLDCWLERAASASAGLAPGASTGVTTTAGELAELIPAGANKTSGDVECAVWNAKPAPSSAASKTTPVAPAAVIVLRAEGRSGSPGQSALSSQSLIQPVCPVSDGQLPTVAPAGPPVRPGESAPRAWARAVPQRRQLPVTTPSSAPLSKTLPGGDSAAPGRLQPRTEEAWSFRLADLRAAAARLPAMPVPLWLAGIGVILMIQGWRRGCFLHLLRRALPAPTAIQRQVDAAAGRLALRRRPDVLLIRSRVSPMIWWSSFRRPPQLILPLPLWLELDAVGRNAVLFHELAHLRRRDHWVRLAGCVLGGVYWWNPVMWWVRSRIHDEAESCCDSWVTWLLPRGRRAYAQALLKTRQYISENGTAVPATGIGVMTRRARRFARRLTVVMTDAGTPRLSGWGLLLISALAMAGWALRPVLACPPEEHKHVVEARATPAPPCAPAQPGTPVPARAPAAPAPWLAPGVMVAPVAPRMAPPGSGPSNWRTRTPRRMGVIAELLPGEAETPDAQEWSTYDQHLAERRGAELEARVARLEEQVAWLSENRAVAASFPADSEALYALGLLTTSDERSSELVWRTYELPEGKLEALTELLVRDDVPVLVRPHDEKIEVQASAAQHEILAAFCRLIHPEFQPVTGSWSPVVLQDVAAGMEAEQRLAEAAARAAEIQVVMQQLSTEALTLQQQASALQAQSGQLEAQAAALEAQAEWIEKLSETMAGAQRAEAVQKAATFTEQARALESQARALELEAEQLREHVAELENRASEVQDADERARERHAR
jgi:hypothetical protein